MNNKIKILKTPLLGEKSSLTLSQRGNIKWNCRIFRKQESRKHSISELVGYIAKAKLNGKADILNSYVNK